MWTKDLNKSFEQKLLSKDITPIKLSLTSTSYPAGCQPRNNFPWLVGGLVGGRNWKQSPAELGQAQLKLGLDCTLIFCRFGFFPFGLIESVWLNRFGLIYLVFYIFKIRLDRFSLSGCSLNLINWLNQRPTLTLTKKVW